MSPRWNSGGSYASSTSLTSIAAFLLPSSAFRPETCPNSWSVGRSVGRSVARSPTVALCLLTEAHGGQNKNDSRLFPSLIVVHSLLGTQRNGRAVATEEQTSAMTTATTSLNTSRISSDILTPPPTSSHRPQTGNGRRKMSADYHITCAVRRDLSKTFG